MLEYLQDWFKIVAADLMESPNELVELTTRWEEELSKS